MMVPRPRTRCRCKPAQATSIVRHSRVNSSMTVRHFSVRSSVQVSVVDQKIMEFICNENERSTNHMDPPAWMKGGTPRQLGPDMPAMTPAK